MSTACTRKAATLFSEEIFVCSDSVKEKVSVTSSQSTKEDMDKLQIPNGTHLELAHTEYQIECVSSKTKLQIEQCLL